MPDRKPTLNSTTCQPPDLRGRTFGARRNVGITPDDLKSRSFAQLYHRCHPLWNTTTEFILTRHCEKSFISHWATGRYLADSEPERILDVRRSLENDMPGSLEEFRGKCILVVDEDNALASETWNRLEASGAMVIGPVPSLTDALDLLDRNRVDAAIIDLDLDADAQFMIANALLAKDIPFVFASAFAPEDVPGNYRGFVVEKPDGLQAIGRKLFGDRPH